MGINRNLAPIDFETRVEAEEIEDMERTNEIAHGWLGIVAKQVDSLKFGVVQITIHESRVVQIEKTEKVRLDKSENREAH